MVHEHGRVHRRNAWGAALVRQPGREVTTCKSRHANCLVDERVEAFSLPSAQRPEIAHVLPVAVLLDLCPKT